MVDGKAVANVGAAYGQSGGPLAVTWRRCDTDGGLLATSLSSRRSRRVGAQSRHDHRRARYLLFGAKGATYRIR